MVQSPSFRLRDLAAVNVPAALELLDVEFPATFSQYDGESAAAFLDRLHFPARARHLALEVFARSFFAHPDDFSAGELVAMFHSYFLGSSEGLLFDVPRDDYDSCLWAPLRRYLERSRGRGPNRRGRRLGGCESGHAADRPGIRHRDRRCRRPGDRSCDHASAGCWTAPCRMSSGWTGSRRCAMRRLSRSGGCGWIGLWHADRPAFLGTSGFGPLDNISVLERFEEGARRWSAEHGGSVVELHAYALVEQRCRSTAQRSTLGRAAPDLSRARSLPASLPRNG